MKSFSILTMALVTLALVSCADKPKPALTPDAKKEPAKVLSPADSAKASQSKEDSIKNAGINAENIENERLEASRKGLEELMNRLMSEEIYFEFDKAVLTEKAKDLLSQAGDILAKEPKLWVEVQGHTDERGTEAYNMTLGGKRAQSVVDYLLSYGVATDRLKSISFGEEKPKAAGTTEDAFAKNRRATFNVKIRK